MIYVSSFSMIFVVEQLLVPFSISRTESLPFCEKRRNKDIIEHLVASSGDPEHCGGRKHTATRTHKCQGSKTCFGRTICPSEALREIH